MALDGKATRACNHLALSHLDAMHRHDSSPVRRGQMVGLVRFELTTSCTPCKRATRLRYSPMIHRKGEEDPCPAPRQALFGLNYPGGFCPRSTRIDPVRAGQTRQTGLAHGTHRSHGNPPYLPCIPCVPWANCIARHRRGFIFLRQPAWLETRLPQYGGSSQWQNQSRLPTFVCFVYFVVTPSVPALAGEAWRPRRDSNPQPPA